MKRDTTKKFLMRENRYFGRMTSREISEFVNQKSKINEMVSSKIFDLIEFSNVFKIESKTILNTSNRIFVNGDKETNVVSQKNKIVAFNMVYCGIEKNNGVPLMKKDFFIGETEVTQELYELVMGKNPSYFCDKNSFGTQFGYQKKIGDTSKHPIEDVDWYKAVIFCNNLSKLQGLEECYQISNEIVWIEFGIKSMSANVVFDSEKNGYRLPTSLEWEYAAKARTKNRFAGTNDVKNLEEYAWFGEEWAKGSTHPVATKKPNEWGLYDMSGNVKEWCNDGSDWHRRIQSNSYKAFEGEMNLEWKSSIATRGDREIGFRIVKNA